MVYWAFAAISLWYLLMTPVRVGAVYASEREKPFRLGVMIWAVRLDIPTSRPRPRKRQLSPLPRDALRQAARVLLKGVSVERLALDVTLRLDDAAKNALVCGLLWNYVGEMLSMLAGAGIVILIRALSAHFRWNLPRAHD